MFQDECFDGGLMQNDARHLLDDMLAEWHRWSKGWQYVSQPKTSAMFASVRISRQWDSEDDVLDENIRNEQMKALDFQISELKNPVWQTALQINARNLAHGCSVWKSPRLPDDVTERQIILRDARNALIRRLLFCGML